MNYRSAGPALATLGALVLLLAGCGGGSPSEGASDGGAQPGASEVTVGSVTPKAASGGANRVQVEALDFAYKADPREFKPGTNEITLKNTGKEDHHLQLIRLDPGKTVNDAMLALRDPSAPPPPWAAYTGGVAAVAAGQSATVVQSLDAATYLLICFVQGPDGQPHFTKGMVTPIEVKGDVNRAALPTPDVEVTAGEYTFNAPEEIEGGELNISFSNRPGSRELHEMGLLRLAPGFTFEDLAAVLASPFPRPAGPSSITAVGGVSALVPGSTGHARVDLAAGNYALVCLVPDRHGTPHAALGMARPLVVK